MNYRKELLQIYDLFPFEKHPLWQGIFRGELSYDEVMRAETQHYLRTQAGQSLRKRALMQALASKTIFPLLLETYLEECTEDQSGPSHLDLIRRLLIEGGLTQDKLDKAQNTPGNVAAIAIYKDITDRGFACHMLGAGVVEHYYSKLSPKIFDAYTKHYGMDEKQANTYKIHGPMDRQHAERAFQIIPDAVELHGWELVQESVRDAFIATSLHYDGMLQGAKNLIHYWDGCS